MNPRTTRLAKEARQLAWAWSAVTLAGLLALFQMSLRAHGWTNAYLREFIVPLGAFLGVPLLASLPIGYELQYRTFSMLLAQPIDRAEIWREKFTVTLAAVLLPAVLFTVAWRKDIFANPQQSMVLAAFIIAMTAGAMFWTALGRSTMGGLALNIGVNWLLFGGWAYFANLAFEWWTPQRATGATGYFSTTFITVSVILFVTYVGALVWLGCSVKRIAPSKRFKRLRGPSTRLIPCELPPTNWREFLLSRSPRVIGWEIRPSPLSPIAGVMCRGAAGFYTRSLPMPVTRLRLTL